MPLSPSSSTESARVADLLAQARAGNAAALERLFTACRGYVRVLAENHLATSLRAKVDASDVVQQTLLEAYRAFGGFRGGTQGEWLAWLRQMTVHNAADCARRYHATEKRAAGREVAWQAQADSHGAPLFEPAANDASPSRQLLDAELELRLADAIAQLSADYRDVVTLRNLQRLSFDEVAQHMGRSRPAVQMLWMRAIQKLQALLSDTDHA